MSHREKQCNYNVAVKTLPSIRKLAVLTLLGLAACGGTTNSKSVSLPAVSSGSGSGAPRAAASAIVSPLAPPRAAQPVERTTPETAARQVLATDLKIQVAQIKTISIEERDWPDGCLGIREPNVQCTQAIVPGFRVMLEAGGGRYEVRTNATGSQVRINRGR